MSGWDYLAACSAVLAAARLEDPRRSIETCACGAMFLTPRGFAGADECGPCYRRAARELDEAADRALYLRWKAGEVSDEVAGLPVAGERVTAAPAQGVLF